MKKYPFKFLDSYNREDKGIFFGRDEEIATLYEMVFQSSVMMIYGASGTGKTSLINCGLASKFEPHDWLALMVRRGTNINDSLNKVLSDAGGNPAAAAANGNSDWADETEKTAALLSPAGLAVKMIYQKSFRPVYLIFDQFEELFILGSSAEQYIFYETVAGILQSEQPVKLIFSIREEYLGHLFEFEHKVPQLLRKKLRIEPMNLEKVKQIIKGVSAYEDSNVRVVANEADLVAEGIFNRIKGKGKTLTIQLPFLQVFLDKFYLKITGDEERVANAEFNLKQLDAMGEIGDVLINFLDEQVSSISKKLSTKYPALTAEMTWKILSPFATPEGTKEPINKQGLYDSLPDQHPDMIDATVDAFINSRILRYNEATDMFEIAHDSLARPITEKRGVEEKALLEIRRLIKNQVAVKEDAREFFTEKQLVFIEPFLDKFKQSSEELDWIKKSRDFIQTQKEADIKKQLEEFAKGKRMLKLIYLIIFLVLVIAGIISFMLYSKYKEAALHKTQSELIKAQADDKKDYDNGIEKDIKLLTVQAELDTIKAAFKNDPKALQKINILQQKVSAAVIQPRIYMHIHTENLRNQMEKLADFLKTKGYIIPGIEAVDDSFAVMQLRYFKHSDINKVNEIIGNLKTVGYTARPQYIGSYENSSKIRQNHFELWWK